MSAAAEQPFRTSPGWAIVAILIGAAFALLLIPEYGLQSQSALVLPALCLSLGLAVGVAMPTLANPAAALRAEHIVIVGLFYWLLLDAVQGTYALWTASYVGIARAFAGIALFAVCLWLGSALAETLRRGVPSRRRLSDLGVEFLFYGGLVAAGAGLLRYLMGCDFNPVCLVETFFLPRMETPWRTNFGKFDTLLLHMRYAGFLCLPFTVALHTREGRVTWRSALLALLALVFLLILIREGGRRHVGMVIGASALVWILLRQQIRWSHLWKLAIVAAGLLLLLQAMAAWRNVGFGVGLLQGQSLDVRGKSGISVDRNLAALLAITTVVPDEHPHTGSQGVIYTVTFPIPRAIFPWRPENRGFDLRRVLGLRVHERWAWTASAVGDLYLIGGWVALAAGGLLFGALANVCSRLLEPPVTIRRRFAFAIGAMVLFIALRALHNGVLMSFAVLSLWGLLVLRQAVMRRVMVLIRRPQVPVPAPYPHRPPA